MTSFFGLTLLLLIATGGCTSSKTRAQASPTGGADAPTGQTPANYRRVAEERLGSGIEYTLNDDKTKVLGKKTAHPLAPAFNNEVRFLVIDVKTDAILFEDRVVNGAVEWFGNTQLKISTIPGIVQGVPDERENYYLYDLVTKQKMAPASGKF